MNGALLEVDNLKKTFVLPHSLFEKPRTVTAVNGVSFTITAGETFGLVGESGSGKSTIGRLIARLADPSGGRITFGGQDWLSLKGKGLRQARRQVQMVFQSPYASLDPRWRVIDIVAEPLRTHLDLGKDELRERCATLLDRVGLSSNLMDRYPHQFSGGQKQRIAIARAIALEPALLIADEPVSALDVSIQAQVLEVLREVRRTSNLAMIFISHDLSVVDYLCERVGVLCQGSLVEIGPTREIFSTPKQAYTQSLIDALPGRRRFQQQI
ncbi:ATP-binding cassette domain-containing protein [Microvirga soli]|jgi:ABC-type oligopeptide transport system ATPase subunit|uniref:ATP-binding cassette domain-containing protein n=1 Tax=Microvirga soli TaxID=1854496 RepID=UPI00191FF44B|nr:ATP-binding cassette domain-containing protein [Microvirga soli]